MRKYDVIPMILLLLALTACSDGLSQKTDIAESQNIADFSNLSKEEETPAEAPFNRYDKSTWFAKVKDGGIEKSRAEEIKTGMTLEEIVAILGRPQRDWGGTVEWDTKEGVLRIHYEKVQDEASPDYDLMAYEIEVRDFSKEPFRMDDSDTWFGKAADGGIDEADAGKIKLDMTLGEVVSIIGKPQRDIGSGMTILEWEVKSGKFLHVSVSMDSSNESWRVVQSKIQTEPKEFRGFICGY